MQDVTFERLRRHILKLYKSINLLFFTPRNDRLPTATEYCYYRPKTANCNWKLKTDNHQFDMDIATLQKKLYKLSLDDPPHLLLTEMLKVLADY